MSTIAIPTGMLEMPWRGNKEDVLNSTAPSFSEAFTFLPLNCFFCIFSFLRANEIPGLRLVNSQFANVAAAEAALCDCHEVCLASALAPHPRSQNSPRRSILPVEMFWKQLCTNCANLHSIIICQEVCRTVPYQILASLIERHAAAITNLKITSPNNHTRTPLFVHYVHPQTMAPQSVAPANAPQNTAILSISPSVSPRMPFNYCNPSISSPKSTTTPIIREILPVSPAVPKVPPFQLSRVHLSRACIKKTTNTSLAPEPFTLAPKEFTSVVNLSLYGCQIMDWVHIFSKCRFPNCTNFNLASEVPWFYNGNALEQLDSSQEEEFASLLRNMKKLQVVSLQTSLLCGRLTWRTLLLAAGSTLKEISLLDHTLMHFHGALEDMLAGFSFANPLPNLRKAKIVIGSWNKVPPLLVSHLCNLIYRLPKCQFCLDYFVLSCCQENLLIETYAMVFPRIAPYLQELKVFYDSSFNDIPFSKLSHPRVLNDLPANSRISETIARLVGSMPQLALHSQRTVRRNTTLRFLHLRRLAIDFHRFTPDMHRSVNCYKFGRYYGKNKKKFVKQSPNRLYGYGKICTSVVTGLKDFRLRCIRLMLYGKRQKHSRCRFGPLKNAPRTATTSMSNVYFKCEKRKRRREVPQQQSIPAFRVDGYPKSIKTLEEISAFIKTYIMKILMRMPLFILCPQKALTMHLYAEDDKRMDACLLRTICADPRTRRKLCGIEVHLSLLQSLHSSSATLLNMLCNDLHPNQRPKLRIIRLHNHRLIMQDLGKAVTGESSTVHWSIVNALGKLFDVYKSIETVEAEVPQFLYDPDDVLADSEDYPEELAVIDYILQRFGFYRRRISWKFSYFEHIVEYTRTT